MKKILYILLLAMPFAGYAQPANFLVKIKLTHVKGTAKAYLRYTLDNKNVIDSAVVKNGEAEIQGTIKDAVRSVLLINRKGTGYFSSDDFLSLYIDKGVTLVSAEDSVKNASVSGTKASAEFNKFREMVQKLNKEGTAIEKMSAAASPALAADPAFQNKIDSLTELAEQANRDAYASFIKENPSSMISLLALTSYDYTGDYSDIEPLFSSLDRGVQQSEAGQKYAARLAILKTVAIGSQAPEFAANDTAGHAVQLSSYRGKYVLLDFWASWCVPCRQENPTVLKAYNHFKNKNFTVLGYSLDLLSEKKAWIHAIETDGLPWTQIADLQSSGNQVGQNPVAGRYGVRAIPSNFLIGPDGRIVAKSLHGALLEKKLAELLKN